MQAPAKGDLAPGKPRQLSKPCRTLPRVGLRVRGGHRAGPSSLGQPESFKLNFNLKFILEEDSSP